jgi:suppressor for copper-sensitivity B
MTSASALAGDGRADAGWAAKTEQSEERTPMAKRATADRGWWLLALLVAAVIVATVRPAGADEDVSSTGASPWYETEQGKVRLIADAPAVGGRDTVSLGLQFALAPHWKIYWRSPGDAGFPPHLDWSRSDNLAAADLAWPVPQRFSVQGLETIGYEGNVVLPISARLKQAGADLALRVALDYLTCSDICVPNQAILELILPAKPAPESHGTVVDAGFADLIRHYQDLVPPKTVPGLALRGAFYRGGTSPTLSLRIASERPVATLDAFVDAPGGVAFGAPVVAPGRSAADETILRLPVSGDDASLAALVGHRLTVTLVDGTRSLEADIVPTEAPPPEPPAAGFLAMLALALVGGLILNLMPCVLPVLSIKLLAIIDHAGRSRLEQRVGFLASAVGILLSFLALAVAMILLKDAGLAVGWGVQFQQPWFLIAMAALLTLFAANLWGFFEVPLPGFAGAFHPDFIQVEGRRQAGFARTILGNVAVGAFATLLATPCSAPFLGTAVGFALAAGPREILGIFLALGLGFALPYLIVALVPGVAYLLPRPGMWMVRLRRVLGVVLALTVLWFLYVLMAQIGRDGALTVGALLLVVAGFLGLAHRPWLRRAVPMLAVAGALLVPLVARVPAAATGADGFWRPFDPTAIASLVGSGRVVFVDVTADWCLTCKVNERLVLDTAAVRSHLRAPTVVAMRGDWTQPSAAISAYLHHFGRYGIPFNAVYGPGAPQGLALSEFLTPDAVTEALRQAAGPPAHAGAAARS